MFGTESKYAMPWHFVPVIEFSLMNTVQWKWDHKASIKFYIVQLFFGDTVENVGLNEKDVFLAQSG